MAFEEKRVLKQITLLPDQNCVQVQWADQVLRDGDVIAETLHRKAYGQEQQEQFAAEVEGAAHCISALGWV